MRIKIFDGCMNFQVHIVPDNPDQKTTWNELAKTVLYKMIDNINDGQDLTNIIRDLSYYIEPQILEMENCGQCGDRTEYLEYELN